MVFPNSIANITFVEINFVTIQQFAKLILKRLFQRVCFLIGDLSFDGRYGRLTHRQRTITCLPIEIAVTGISLDGMHHRKKIVTVNPRLVELKQKHFPGVHMSFPRRGYGCQPRASESSSAALGRAFVGVFRAVTDSSESYSLERWQSSFPRRGYGYQSRASESSSAALGRGRGNCGCPEGARELNVRDSGQINEAEIVYCRFHCPYRANPFFDRCPRAALGDELALGWYPLRFQRKDATGKTEMANGHVSTSSLMFSAASACERFDERIFGLEQRSFLVFFQEFVLALPHGVETLNRGDADSRRWGDGVLFQGDRSVESEKNS